MAKKTELKERGTGETLYPVTTTDCILDWKGGAGISEEKVNELIEESLHEEVTPTNGYDYVDMGEAGIWAAFPLTKTKNSKRYDDVLYFAWGETVGYTRQEAKDGLKSFTQDSYKWGKENALTKYCTDASYGTVDNKTQLELEDDAAHINMGGQWRMPTIEEFKKLESLCDVSWGSNAIFTLKTDSSKALEFPSVNNIFHNDLGDLLYPRYQTHIPSSTLYTNTTKRGNNLARAVFYEYDEDYGNEGDIDDDVLRYYGSAIIAILDPTIPYESKTEKYADKKELEPLVGKEELSTTLRAYAKSTDLAVVRGNSGENICKYNRVEATEGQYSCNLGSYTETINLYETSIGCLNTIHRSAYYSFGQPENTLFTIGNGRLEGKRHNAFEVRESGDIYIPNTNVKEGDRDDKPMIKLQDYLFNSWIGTQSEYDLIDTKDPNTFYFIKES